jgi:putative transcriptional regulator
MNLKQIRKEKNYTQEEVGRRSSITRNYYTQIELGVRVPSVTVAKAIASVLEFDWRLFYEDDKQTEKT